MSPQRPRQCHADGPAHPGREARNLALAALTLLLTACATPPERYPAPPAGEPTAELQVLLPPPGRNRSVAVYVPGAVKCNAPGWASKLNRTIEDPHRLVAASWESPSQRVVPLPAGVPLPLRVHDVGPRGDWTLQAVAVLEPGRRYVLDLSIFSNRVSLTDSVTQQPPPALPANWFHATKACPG